MKNVIKYCHPSINAFYVLKIRMKTFTMQMFFFSHTCFFNCTFVNLTVLKISLTSFTSVIYFCKIK